MASKTLRRLFFAALAMLIGVPLVLYATQDEPAAAATDPPRMEAYDKSAANCPEAKTDDRPEPEPKYYWDDDNLTPLHEAAKVNDVAEVKRLIAAGADVDAKGESGTTPLVLAAHADATEALAELLKAGADIEAKWGEGATPLLAAVSRDAYNSIALLLKSGADANAKTDYGITSLHIIESPKLAELLIQHGADIDARTNSADDVMHLANGNETPLHTTHSAEVAKVLIKHGADVNARDDSQEIPLHTAVYRSCDLVMLLINHCSDLWAENKNGDTPLEMFEKASLGTDLAKMSFQHASSQGPMHVEGMRIVGSIDRYLAKNRIGIYSDPIWSSILLRDCEDV